MKLSIIIVSYNSAPFLEAGLHSLYDSLKNSTFELFVVDNNSQDTSADLVKTFFPKVRLILNKINIGFGAACNQVLRQAKGEYLLLMNPDVRVHPTTLSEMVSYLQNHRNIGILAPQLRFANGSLQYSCRRYPRFPSHFAKILFSRSPLTSDYLMLDKDHTLIQDIDWSLGAFLLVRKQVIDQIGGFDERFFLYFEDIDLCRRAKQAGWRVVYYPKAVATHLYQQASHRLFSKPFFYHLMSMYKYYRKYGFRQ
ncbi:glycosyltransferase family 2 protein [Candidatus Woesearchaeota archaeon]|nr:glycosyltransferase family 2 protein [Candidatus Woesearchaeota archaeon]